MSLTIRHRTADGSNDANGLFDDAMPPLLRRIVATRGVRSQEELIPGLPELPPPSLLLGMDEAVGLLLEQRRRGGRLLIVGDYDADGATSCAVLMRALPALGFAHCDYLVPNRFEYGYGLTPEIVALAAQRSPDLIITVDNGISSIEGVEAANRLGIPVLITDHHLPGARLPAAAAIINPNRADCPFPAKTLAGVGVAFYLALGVRAALRDAGEGGDVPRLADLLDLVALGTVADVVPLDAVNRTLVHEGLRRIRAGRACAGILAILDVAGRERADLVASDLGFAVGPRLNAAGRLEDISLGIECLLSDDPVAARQKAMMLDDINRQRREIETQMRAEADQALAGLQPGDSDLPAGLCLYDPQWHHGVVGILASRLKDRFHRPVIVFADEGQGADGQVTLKGSARSVSGFHVRDALEAIATAHPGLITRFGGHAMAAGLSLPASHYERFVQAFSDVALAGLGEEAGHRVWLTDGELEPPDMNLQTATLLRGAAPWGQAFPEPRFDGVFELRQQRLLAGRHLKLLVSPPGSERVLEAIAFNADLDSWPAEPVRRVQLVYRLDINRYRGETRLQMIVDALAPC